MNVDNIHETTSKNLCYVLGYPFKRKNPKVTVIPCNHEDSSRISIISFKLIEFRNETLWFNILDSKNNDIRSTFIFLTAIFALNLITLIDQVSGKTESNGKKENRKVYCWYANGSRSRKFCYRIPRFGFGNQIKCCC